MCTFKIICASCPKYFFFRAKNKFSFWCMRIAVITFLSKDVYHVVNLFMLWIEIYIRFGRLLRLPYLCLLSVIKAWIEALEISHLNGLSNAIHPSLLSSNSNKLREQWLTDCGIFIFQLFISKMKYAFIRRRK